MDRFTGTCEPFASVEVGGIANWVKAIPLSTWPQQCTSEIKPSMVTDPNWHGFGDKVHYLVTTLMNYFPECSPFQRMLSVVMPGHSIEPHKDMQAPYWICRVHVPLLTNDKSFTTMDDGDHHLDVGTAYKVNTMDTHAVRNDGKTPRIHFMFDVRTI